MKCRNLCAIMYQYVSILVYIAREVKIMQKNIHPDYKETEIRCACGNVLKTKSTKSQLTVDVCSKCHPFFTGQQRFVDSGGRVDRFEKRRRLSQQSK